MSDYLMSKARAGYEEQDEVILVLGGKFHDQILRKITNTKEWYNPTDFEFKKFHNGILDHLDELSSNHNLSYSQNLDKFMNEYCGTHGSLFKLHQLWNEWHIELRRRVRHSENIFNQEVNDAYSDLHSKLDSAIRIKAREGKKYQAYEKEAEVRRIILTAEEDRKTKELHERLVGELRIVSDVLIAQYNATVELAAKERKSSLRSMEKIVSMISICSFVAPAYSMINAHIPSVWGLAIAFTLASIFMLAAVWKFYECFISSRHEQPRNQDMPALDSKEGG